MKINKKLFICALLVLMLVVCINAVSADETLNETLGADSIDEISIDEVPVDELSASGDTIVVDKNGGGDYDSISAAVGAATGGETILIKNGEYTEETINGINKQLTFTGESQDGVVIKSTGTTGFLYTTESGYTSLNFYNLTFKDIGTENNAASILIGGNGDVNIKDCTFDGCYGRYGSLRILTSGSAVIDNCKILNSESSTGSYSSAVDFGGSYNSEYTMKNTIIDGSKQKSTSTASYIFGVIYNEKSGGSVTLDNVTISNCVVPASGIITAKGNMNIKRSKFINNSVSRDNQYSALFFISTGSKTVNIESSVIANNSEPNYVVAANSGTSSFDLNYNNIHDNTYKVGVNHATSGTYSLEANYWGSNDLPEGVTASTWIVEDKGEYKLNTGDELAKEVPELVKEEVLPEGAIYVSASGNDENDGSSEATAIQTLSHAVEIAASRENKTATVYILNGDYTTGAIDINDDLGVSLSIIGQEKGKVVIHGTGAYIFNVYGDNLSWNLKNLDIVDISSTSGTSAGLIFYGDGGNFTVENCNFRNITSKLGAIALGADNANGLVYNCKIEGLTTSSSSASAVTVNGDGNYTFDYVEISNCGLSESYATSNTAILRSVFYVNTYEANVNIYNSKISSNNGPKNSLIETRSNLNIVNTTIVDNIVDAALNGANGGDCLFWTSNVASNLKISNCIIENNTALRAGKGLFYNQKGETTVEYSSIAANNVDKLIGSTGTITANNNWWGTNDQPDSKIDNWVIMNVELDDSELSRNNKINLIVDFNHVKTSSGTVEELTGGEIPKNSYSVDVSAQNGEITPANIAVNKGEVKTQTFTVTNLNDVITLTCDGDVVEVPITGVEPYRGIIYVNKTGNNDNDGSIDAPVADLAKAIELANDALGQIVIDEGTYVGNSYHVTKALNITGVGNVVLDANGQGRIFTMSYGDKADYLILTNLTLAGANHDYGQAIYSFADELVLNNVNITNNPGSGTLVKNYGKLTMDNCIIANHNGGTVIDTDSSKDILITNTLFENNTVSDYAIIYSSTTLRPKEAIIENTTFRSNIGQLGIIKIGHKTNVKNSKFIDNTNRLGSGGAISDCDVVTVDNSTFINNMAGKGAGAINIGYNKIGTITHSVFINNKANANEEGYKGDAISNTGKLTVNYCVLLTNAENSIIYSDSEYATNAQYNWWGSNDNPSSLNGVGTYEDDWDEEVYSEIDSSNWVYMNVATDMDDNVLNVGQTAEITVDFTNYIDSSNNLKPLSEKIPEVNVTATAVNGELDVEQATTENSIVKFTYAATAAGEDTITIASADETVKITVNVYEDAEGLIFVLPGASDSNPGTRAAPVGTIAHAIEIATEGQIVLLPGVHKTDDLGTISSDLNITGEGYAVIDADNNHRILYVGEDANVVIKNVVMVNGYTAENSGALLGNNNCLTLINCTLANSTTGPMYNGGAIYSVGKLNIINTTIANCSAREGGAIFSNNPLSKGNTIVLVNSKFINNSAFGNDNLGGGAIFTQQITEFTIDNTSFVENKATSTSSGGAIFISHSSTEVKITNSEFIANHANGQTSVGGGAIYRAATSNYVKEGTMTITGTLFENNTCDANGGAIYIRASTLNVANSVFINNNDANGLAVYGYKTDLVTPTITLNDNWWGSNDSPKNLVGGNSRYVPTINRWAILTVTNDTPIEPGNTVKLTVSINNYTTGTENGALSSPITIPRDVAVITNLGNANGILVNGEFTHELTVENNLKYLAVNVDNETVVLYVVSSDTIVKVDDITAKKYDKVNVTVNVTTIEGVPVNNGNIELYADDDLIATIPVLNGQATKEVVISKDENTYELIAKFVDETGLFDGNQSSATLTVSGICELVNATFFNFFDEEGTLRDEIVVDELVFHGDFSGLGVNTIKISRPMTVSGDNAVLYNMAYMFEGDDISLNNITLIVNGEVFTNNNGAAIYASGANIEISDVVVNYTAVNNKESFGIVASSAAGFKLIDSEINFNGNNYAELVHQAALIVAESSDVEIRGNLINASMPARDVAFNYYYPDLVGIYQDLALGIGIQGGSDIYFTENNVIVDAKRAEGSYSTLDSLMADSVENLVISANNFTQTDFTGEGKAGYANVVDLYNFNGVTVENNNILINTTTGEEGAGTAYPVQATGPYSGLLITNNNLTAISKGPALGIYSQNYDGATDIVVTFNNINVTGYATPNEYALVAGMELQDTQAKVYNNTIYSQSIAAYDELNQLYGISYAQYTSGAHTYDIQNNTVFTEGKYAVYFRDAKNSNVTENVLYAHELKGDASVSVAGENNVIVNNYPTTSNLASADLEMAYKDGSAWSVTLTDANGNAISGVAVNIGVKVGGVDKVYSRVTDADGVASLPLNLNPGTYAINATFEGNDKYESAFTNATVTVGKAAPVLAGEDLTMTYKDGAWSVTLTGVDGAPISGVAIKIGINTGNADVVYSRSTDANGVASLPINLAPGSYAVNATFDGNFYYESAFVNATVTVEKAVATISAEDLTMNYKDGSKYNVTVVDADGAALAGVVVKFTIGNSNYNIKTDANGVASLPINLAIGEYTISAVVNDAKYSSDSISNAISVENNLRISASDVNMTYKDGTAYEVQLVNSEGNPVALAGEIVKITVKGKTYDRKTDANGIASLPINLLAGEYVLTAEYNGVEITNNVTVNKA